MGIAEEKVVVEAPRSDVHRASTAPRITVPLGQRYPWYVRMILALQRRKYGAEFESARLWGLLPRSFLMLSMLYRTLDRAGSPIEAGLRALVQVRISQINWCAFCIDANGAVALERAVTPKKLAALDAFEASPLYSDAEKAALAYAEAMTDSTRGVDDALFARLRQHFGEREIIELTALAAFQNLSSKFNAALGVPAQGFCAQGGAAPARGDK